MGLSRVPRTGGRGLPTSEPRSPAHPPLRVSTHGRRHADRCQSPGLRRLASQGVHARAAAAARRQSPGPRPLVFRKVARVKKSTEWEGRPGTVTPAKSPAHRATARQEVFESVARALASRARARLPLRGHRRGGRTVSRHSGSLAVAARGIVVRRRSPPRVAMLDPGRRWPDVGECRGVPPGGV